MVFLCTLPKSALFGHVRFAGQHLLLPLMTSTLDLGLIAVLSHFHCSPLQLGSTTVVPYKRYGIGETCEGQLFVRRSAGRWARGPPYRRTSRLPRRASVDAQGSVKTSSSLDTMLLPHPWAPATKYARPRRWPRRTRGAHPPAATSAIVRSPCRSPHARRTSCRHGTCPRTRRSCCGTALRPWRCAGSATA